MANPGDRTGFDMEGAKVVYERLSNDRAPYITRAERNAQYTIPAVFPKSSDNSSTDYATPYQSVGARGVNNLSAKLMLAMMPVGNPFFKLAINEYALKQVDPEVVTTAQIGLSMVERIGMRYLEAIGLRPTASELMKQLVVAGNGLLYMPPGEMKTKLYRLHAYVVERDSLGEVLQIIAKDNATYATLPEDVKGKLPANDYQPDTKVEIYTHTYRDHEGDQWLSYQEVEGEVIKGTENTYPAKGNPWIPVRLYKIDGESYGRSFVEEYIGDLVSLENLSKSIVDFAQACSKVLFLVNPAGMTSIRRVVKAANGSFVAGRKADIEVFQMDKYADFQVTKSTADGIETRLSFAFMLNSAVQRSGERVTAEEIRYVANELEATQGGIYSVLSTEYQLPVVQRLMIELEATSKIPSLPQEAIEPQIITGLDAIGRGQDLDQLMTFANAVQPAMSFAAGDINWSNYILRVAEAAGIDPDGLVLTQEEKAAQAGQQAAVAGVQAAGQAAGAVAGQNIAMAGTDPANVQAAMAQ